MSFVDISTNTALPLGGQLCLDIYCRCGIGRWYPSYFCTCCYFNKLSLFVPVPDSFLVMNLSIVGWKFVFSPRESFLGTWQVRVLVEFTFYVLPYDILSFLVGLYQSTISVNASCHLQVLIHISLALLDSHLMMVNRFN